LTVLWLLGVLAPIPLAMLLAEWLKLDAVALAGMVVSLALAWLLLRSRGHRWAEVGLHRGISPGRLLLTVLPSVVVLLAVNALLSSLLAQFGLVPDLGRFAFLRGNLGALLVMLVVVWTVAAFGEEMLFRGLLLNTLAELFEPHAGRRYAWALALVVTSVVVGAGHVYYGPAGIIITGVLGAGFGLVYLMAQRNLWAPILTHGLFDTVAFIILYVALNQASPPSCIFGMPGGGPGIFVPGHPMAAA
jgi:membrane protease YdiL (CAAX protease family)